MNYCQRDHEDGCATWQPQGVGSEAYLSGTSQGPTPEDARKDDHIIRARCAPLSPASGFPVSWSQQVIHEISGLKQICQLSILTPKMMERRVLVICSAFFSSESQTLQS